MARKQTPRRWAEWSRRCSELRVVVRGYRVYCATAAPRPPAPVMSRLPRQLTLS